MKHRVPTKSQCYMRWVVYTSQKDLTNSQPRLLFNYHTMNKAPSLGKESSPRSPFTPDSRTPWRRESQGPPPWSPPTTASTSPRSSKLQDDAQSEIFDTNSSTTISGDPGQHRMVVAIDYGTTFSGKHEETLGRHLVLKSLELF